MQRFNHDGSKQAKRIGGTHVKNPGQQRRNRPSRNTHRTQARGNNHVPRSIGTREQGRVWQQDKKEKIYIGCMGGARRSQRKIAGSCKSSHLNEKCAIEASDCRDPNP